MRIISGVIIGYLLFAVSAFLLFRVTHQDPHAPTVMGFEIVAILYGVFFAFLAGYWGTGIAGRSDMVVASIIAVIMAAGCDRVDDHERRRLVSDVGVTIDGSCRTGWRICSGEEGATVNPNAEPASLQTVAITLITNH